MYLEVKGVLPYRLKKVDFSGMLEYDMAPKFMLLPVMRLSPISLPGFHRNIVPIIIFPADQEKMHFL